MAREFPVDVAKQYKDYGRGNSDAADANAECFLRLSLNYMVRIRAFGTRDHDSNFFCSVCTLDLNNLNREIQLGLLCRFLQTISTVLMNLSKDDKKALSGRLGEGFSDTFNLYLRYRARW